MRKTVFSTNMSLDGFIAGPGDDLSWGITDEELHQEYADQIKAADLMLYGRVTYQLLADYWPAAELDPSLPAGMLAFAKAINAIPKIVYSHTLEKVSWNTRLVRDFDAQEIALLKRQPGKDLLIAGSAFASSLMKLNLIDEYWLFIHPVVLGQGKPLFRGIVKSIPMRLIETGRLKSGVVKLHYASGGTAQEPAVG